MRTIVISDIHLGVDDRIAECVQNRSLLISFLEHLRREKQVDEVVINGDFLDQWFYPGDYEITGDSNTFYLDVAANNAPVIDAFKALLADGIKVVYIPGNHDMTLSAATLDQILPGIVQARDTRGLGRYRTGCRSEVVIEHSHRYELFCAPDPFSNLERMTHGQPILPPGYFYARLGVTSLMENFPQITKDLGTISTPNPEDGDQYTAYLYFKTWEDLINHQFPVTQTLDDPFIQVAVDGFQGRFSIADLVPTETKHHISAKLYTDIQRRWEKVQQHNLVPAPTTALFQMQHTTNLATHIQYSRQQYFDLDPTVDVVVFGHTHVPAYHDFSGDYGQTKCFVNEGTWVDHNFDDLKNTATFADIHSGEKTDSVFLLKCLGTERLEDIVSVENAYVKR